MKFSRTILSVAVALTLVSSSFQTEDDEYRIVNRQEYIDNEGNDPALLSPQQDLPSTEEIVPLRRVRRPRVNRRRRLRKRIRTTTESPVEDIVDDQRVLIDDNVAKALEEVYSTLPPIDETTTMRRKTKRRRRKRKHNKKSGQNNKRGNEDEDKTEGSTRKPHRRRRKGGRRKVRPTAQIGTTDANKIELYIETTMIPFEEATTVVYDLGSRALEKLEQEEKNGRIYQIFDSRNNLVSQPSYVEEPSIKMEPTPQTVTRKPHKYRPYGVKSTENTIKPEVTEYIKTTNTIKTDDEFVPIIHEPDYVNTIKPVKSTIVNQQDAEFDQLLTNTIKPVEQFDGPLSGVESTNRETKRVPTVVHIRPEFGVKVFDRKALFSKSRKLPETSAIIRRKLNPRLRNQHKNESSAMKTTEVVKMNVDSTTVQPMDSSRLIERLTAHAKSYRTTAPTTSTPTYKSSTTTTTSLPATCRTIETTTQSTPKPSISPKMTVTTMKPTTEMIFKARFNKVIELHRSRGKSIFTTPKYDFPSTEQTTTPATTVNVPIVEIDTTQSPIEETTETVSTSIDNLNLNILNLNKLNDSIAELLKTESGNIILSGILESRNMTLAQLLDHRERGSSRFVLADIFAEKKSLIAENTTAEDEEEVPLVDVKPTILFPNEEVMGTFPSFISDKIQKVDSNNKESSPKGYYTTLKAVVRIDNREPRVFDSLPEFSTTTIKEEIPTRPKTTPLKPLSIRGNYEEIQIALKPTAKTDEIGNVYVVDADEELRTNRIASNLGAERKADFDNHLGAFRKVSVKSAVVISGGIIVLALFGFLSLLISCRLRQKKTRLLRAKRSVLCERLTNEEFMNSQQSLSPVLTKQQRFTAREPVQKTTTAHNQRQYYLWRTLRKTFQYD